MKRRVPYALVAVMMLACGLGTVDSGFAIDIVLVWDDLDENPSFDRNGTKLMAVAEAAAEMWERLIPSPGTHHIDVSWSHLEPHQLGYWKLDPFGNNNIYFNADSDWFIDSTPFDHGEYSFGDPFEFRSDQGSYLFGMTDGAGAWFDGTTPPDTLEIGSVGLPTRSAPDAVKNNSDLLSVVLHEIGHDLGVGGDVLSGRYPIYAADLSGVAGVEVIEGDFEDPGDEDYGDENGHVAPPMALMSPSIDRGMRTLPSAMDVLVAARDSNYLSVDLERKFVGIGTNWNSSSTWIGGAVPDGNDDAYVVHGGTIGLSGPGRADNLYIGKDSVVRTGANSLTVDNLLQLEGNPGVALRVNQGGSVTVGDLQAPTSALLDMAGGTLNVLGTAGIGGDVIGEGRVDFDGFAAVTGSVTAEGRDLAITGDGAFRLLHIPDKVFSGRLRAASGDLKLGLPFAAASNGEIYVNSGRRLVITRDQIIPNAVELYLNGTLASEGASTDVTVSHLEVGFNGSGTVVARTLTLDAYANVDDGGRLTLASPVRTTLQGGLSIFGDGLLKQEGDILVTGGNVRLDVQTLDWGNSTPTQSNDLRINPGSTLDVNSEVVGVYRGQVIVDSGVLQVDTPGGWQLGGESATTAGGILSLINSGAAPTVRGTPMVARHWIVASGGNAFIESDLTVMPTAQVIAFGADARLFLAGHTTLRGGGASGLGALVQRGDIDVTEDTTIGTATFSWGNSLGLELNSITVHAGDTLTVNSSSTGSPDNRFRGTFRLDGGTLVVNTDAGWTLPATQLLQHAGVLELDGDVVAPRVQGQSLTVGGRIHVTGGSAHLDADVVFQNTHETSIAAGSILHVNGAADYLGGVFTGPGALQHNGTALLSSSNPLTAARFLQNGRLTVANPSNAAAINAQVIDFRPDSLTRLFTDLHLQGAAVLRTGAIFEGTGTPVVDPVGMFTGGGSLGVDLDNQGTVRPGISPGTLEIDGDYTQGASGTLQIEVGGTNPGEWDQLSASGSVSLEGKLNVLLLGGFVPEIGDSFTIVNAAGGLAGTFGDLDFPSLPLGRSWSIDYTPTSVVVSTVAGLPGDTNGDQQVDVVDLNNVRNNFGASGAGVDGDTNGDNVVNVVDLNNVRNNFGASASVAVSEPATGMLAACGLVLLVFSNMRWSGLLKFHNRKPG